MTTNWIIPGLFFLGLIFAPIVLYAAWMEYTWRKKAMILWLAGLWLFFVAWSVSFILRILAVQEQLPKP